ncbi:MAG: copper resistance CopC family protein [Microbacterium sp.]|uniref:copper resistance CopC family protein n=1 Tax=Microbacterium sp. TaxID=51671 RepID=UPI003F8195CC
MSQTLHIPRTARLSALIAALTLVFLAVLGTASPAAAHDALVGTDPAVDSTVAQLPQQVTLTFSEEVADDEGATVIEVKDAAGKSLTDGSPVVQDNTVTQSLTGEASGVVTVTWKIVSSDGHPTSNAFSFTVEGAAEPAPTPTESATVETEPGSPTPTLVDEDNMEVDPIATLLVNPLTWLAIAILVGAVVALIVSARRRQARQNGSGPGSDSPADH